MFAGTVNDVSEVDSAPQIAGEDPETNTKIANHFRL